MPILKRPEQLIVDRINLENKTDLKLTDVTLFTPRVPTTAEEIQNAQGRNSFVRIAATPLANATGATFVYYNRLDFTAMFTDETGIQPLIVPVDFDTVFTAWDVVPFINQYYGLMLEPKDVLEETINRGDWTVQLKAHPDSLGWIGEVPVQLVRGDALVPTNFTDVKIAPYAYPYFNTKVGQGAIYSYPWRFDNFAAELQGMGTTTNETRLAQILKSVTADNWMVYRSPVDFNLKEATVVYNGKNSRDLPTNPSVDNVMVIELSLYCLNFGGRLYLHYNDPE